MPVLIESWIGGYDNGQLLLRMNVKNNSSWTGKDFPHSNQLRESTPTKEHFPKLFPFGSTVL